MLADYQIEIKSYAKYKDTVKVVTYIGGMNKFYGLRCFEIYNEKEELLLKGTTLVILVDTKRRRPKPIPKELYEVYGIYENNSEIGKNKLKLKAFEEADIESNIEIKYADLDFNYHVGNVKYVEFALDTIPLDTMKKYKLEKVYIRYNKEIGLNDKIKVLTKMESSDNKIVGYHEIINNEEKSIALLETHWR